MPAFFNSQFVRRTTFDFIFRIIDGRCWPRETLVRETQRHSGEAADVIDNSLELLIEVGLLWVDKGMLFEAHTANLVEFRGRLEAHISHGFLKQALQRGLKHGAEGGLLLSAAMLYPSFRGLIQILAEFSIIEPAGDYLWALSQDYHGLLRELWRCETVPKKTISIIELRARLQAQELIGEAAEEFVLKSERLRMRNHRLVAEIRQISKVDVAAGYDIISFQSEKSEILDKFIEVKAISGDDLAFYISRNEIITAIEKQASYFLALVRMPSGGNEELHINEIRNPNRIFGFRDLKLDFQFGNVEAVAQSFRFCVAERQS